MKSKKSFPDVQPWRIMMRNCESLQMFTVIALGSLSSRAEAHVRKFFPKKDYEIVDIYPITTSTMVAFACFCEQYANPIQAVDLTYVPQLVFYKNEN